MVEVKPTLFLRFISPEAVFDKMMKGEYDNVTLRDTDKVNVEIKRIIQENYPENCRNHRFTMQTRDGSRVNFYTINCAKATRCRFCASDFPKGTLSTQIPIRYEVQCIVRKGLDSKTRKIQPVRSIERAFYGDKNFCDFNCALAYFIEHPSEFPEKTESRLRQLHTQIYPDSGMLEPAQSPDLLDIHGGSLTYAEYKAESNEVYRKINGTIVEPEKGCFARF